MPQVETAVWAGSSASRAGAASGALRLALLVVLFATVPCLGLLHHAARLELDVGVLFLVPVLLVARLSGRRAGVVMAAASGATTTAAELMHVGQLLHPATPWWNGLAGFLVLGAVAWLSTAMREATAREYSAARSDPLTRVANRRLLMERIHSEIHRCRDTQRPLSVAYLDCDGFKHINDEFGHQAGDRVLQALAELLQEEVRKDDTVARMGGDEFALVLPGTSEDEARATVSRVLRGLAASELLAARGAVSLSAGVATFRGTWTVDDVLTQADRLLLEAKGTGKHRAVYRSFCRAARTASLDLPQAATANHSSAAGRTVRTSHVAQH